MRSSTRYQVKARIGTDKGIQSYAVDYIFIGRLWYAVADKG